MGRSHDRDAIPLREVPATFGRRETHPDAAWECEFSGHLRETQSAAELQALFARFRGSEDAVGVLIRRAVFRALCRSVGNDVQISPEVVLQHPETMEFGDSVFLGAHVTIQGRFDGTCRFGSHVWIGPHAYFDARDLIVEDYVGWGPGAKVLGSMHTGLPIDVPIISTSLEIRPVRVGYGADIGTNATILPGVHIGAHAIVGAGAVVTSDVPDYAVVAGVPARILRSRLDCEQQ